MKERKDLGSEFVFTASKSSGPGGQNVNKVSTRIELRFNIGASVLLDEDEKKTLMDSLSGRITKHGILRIVSQSGRTQLENKEYAVERFYALIEKALTPKKTRTATRPTFASRTKRLQIKQIHSQKKNLRRTLPDE